MEGVQPYLFRFHKAWKEKLIDNVKIRKIKQYESSEKTTLVKLYLFFSHPSYLIILDFVMDIFLPHINNGKKN